MQCRMRIAVRMSADRVYQSWCKGANQPSQWWSVGGPCAWERAKGPVGAQWGHGGARWQCPRLHGGVGVATASSAWRRAQQGAGHGMRGRPAGLVRQTLPFSDADGQPMLVDCNGGYLAVGTSKNLVRIFKLGGREARPHAGPGELVATGVGGCSGVYMHLRGEGGHNLPEVARG